MKKGKITRQCKAYIALAIVFGTVIFALLTLMGLFWLAFVLLVAALLALALIKMKKPELLEKVIKREGGAENDAPKTRVQQAAEFHSHIILVNTNGLRSEPVEVNSPIFVIGRKACDYILSDFDRNVSRQHAEIRYNEATGRSMFMNLSPNGSRINGQNLIRGESRALQNNDVIQIADYTLLVQSKNY